ncbi:MAG: hydroxyacid dehydrogenase [Anaerolineae bacterium]|jgi:phosphoglycerate dehydrogenase-like enzyme|nr:hydroxyacid dehydrogenase [Chloroflexota bacterium]
MGAAGDLRRPRAAFFGGQQLYGRASQVDYVYGPARRAQIAQLTELYPQEIHAGNLDRLGELRDLEVIFGTWGMPALDAAALDQLPELRAVFYAAGTVHSFARPLLERGIVLTSAWAANAIPVAEFALAQILLGCKGYFRNVRDYGERRLPAHDCYRGPGIYEVPVALIGAGQVARALIERLKPFQLQVLLVDPFLSPEEAQALGVRLVSLEEAFGQAFVVSNHLPNLPELQGVIDRQLLALLQPGAVLINTGRGAQVVEQDLIAVLQERPDLTALLDVTFPEPPDADSLLYTLPNVHLSSHIAGSLNNEVGRLADYAIEAFLQWRAGKTPRYAITQEMLARLA